MVRSVPTDDMEEQAARWAARIHYGDMLARHEDGLNAWLVVDQRHYGALLRARAALYVLEDAVVGESGQAGDSDSLTPSPAGENDNGVRSPRWRGVGLAVIGGAAFAASIAAFIGFASPLLWPGQPSSPASSDHVLALEDGSIARLAEGARIQVAFQGGIRKVVLLSGGATFEVAGNRPHPFVVQSGDVYAQATGTVYSVRRIGETGGAVRVVEGSVLVWARDERDQAVLLHEGGSLTLDPGVRPIIDTVPARTAPPPELAQIAFDNETITAAAKRFNRINQVKIVIADQSIGNVRIDGLFRANDPEQFAKAAAAIAGARADKNENGNVINIK